MIVRLNVGKGEFGWTPFKINKNNRISPIEIRKGPVWNSIFIVIILIIFQYSFYKFLSLEYEYPGKKGYEKELLSLMGKYILERI